MSKRTVTFKVCDGCRKNDRDHEIEIVQSRSRFLSSEFSDETVDMCNECDDKDRYICNHCRSVHGDDNACEAVRAVIDDPPSPDDGIPF